MTKKAEEMLKIHLVVPQKMYITCNFSPKVSQ